MIKKHILVRWQGIMYWIDCYVEEGILFKKIEDAAYENRYLYQEGLINMHTYLVIKYRLMRLLDELEEVFTEIYEEVHC